MHRARAHILMGCSLYTVLDHANKVIKHQAETINEDLKNGPEDECSIDLQDEAKKTIAAYYEIPWEDHYWYRDEGSDHEDSVGEEGQDEEEEDGLASHEEEIAQVNDEEKEVSGMGDDISRNLSCLFPFLERFGGFLSSPRKKSPKSPI